MDRVGAMARETFTIDISGTFLENLAGDPLLDLNGHPLPVSAVTDNGWEEIPEWVVWREAINGEFKWQKQGREQTISAQETMMRRAEMRVRRWEVTGIRPEMRVQRVCDSTYFDILYFHDDPGNGLYVNIFLERIN